MGTYTRRPPTWRERHDLWWLGLVFMGVSAAIVLAAGWFVLQAFLGMAQYIRSL